MNKEKALRIIFAGTPEFAATHLQSLLATHHEICAVYTQPDRPAGRGRKLMASPVKQLALQHSLDIRQPKTLHTSEDIDALKSLNADLMLVVAYGIILKQEELDAPRLGCINVHASLLPRWRGAAPIQRAIAAGDKETGITVMQMVKALDAGDMLASNSCLIHSDDTAATLHDRLAMLGAHMLPQSIADYQSGKLSGIPQDVSAVTYASKLHKQDAILDWEQSAQHLEQKIRAFNPWPIATTVFKNKTIRIHASQVQENTSENTEVGGVIAVSKQGIDVATGERGVLRLQTLQLSGRKPLPAAQFLNGLSICTGDSFL